MPDFAYVARNPSGDRITGTIAANNHREALNLLSGKALFPLEVNEARARVPIMGGRVKGQQLATLYGQLSQLLRSGVPLLRSLRVLRDQASNMALKKVLDDVHSRVEEGETLAAAMGRHQRVFGEMAINLVRAGGEGGFLEDSLERVAQFTEQQEDLKGRTAGAIAYPVVLMVIGGVIISGLMVFVVPKFGEMFEGLRKTNQMPVLTEWLLAVSAFLRSYGLYAVMGVVAAAILVRRYLQSEQGRRLRDTLKIRLPLFGIVFKNLAVARFCRVLGTLLKNGVPILNSLEIARGAAGNVILSEAIQQASENITAGESLAKPLAACGHFPPTVVEMISVAEESNTLDSVLVNLADSLEKQTSRTLDLAVRLLEPLLLLAMASVVLLVAIALLLPILNISSSFG